MERQLHPNLARIAAAYDEVVLEFRQGRMTTAESRRRISALVARDDNGIEWSIDPDSGQWRYKNKWGGYAIAEPPAYGVLAATPQDLGAGNGKSLDERVSFTAVDMDSLTRPGSLSGSTLITSSTGDAPRRRKRRRAFPVRPLLAVLMIAAVVAAVMWASSW